MPSIESEPFTVKFNLLIKAQKCCCRIGSVIIKPLKMYNLHRQFVREIVTSRHKTPLRYELRTNFFAPRYIARPSAAIYGPLAPRKKVRSRRERKTKRKVEAIQISPNKLPSSSPLSSSPPSVPPRPIYRPAGPHI